MHKQNPKAMKLSEEQFEDLMYTIRALAAFAMMCYLLHG